MQKIFARAGPVFFLTILVASWLATPIALAESSAQNSMPTTMITADPDSLPNGGSALKVPYNCGACHQQFLGINLTVPNTLLLLHQRPDFVPEPRLN